MHSPPAVSAEEDRQYQRYSRNGITSQPFTKQTYDLCIWLPPPAIPTGCARSTTQPCHEPKMSHPNLFLNTVGTDFIAQVVQTCYHSVAKTPDNSISITGMADSDAWQLESNGAVRDSQERRQVNNLWPREWCSELGL
ncbi:hypothetical protein GEV33_005480 [Tenebrio molitor]|uniref:Uncharacterized protein n=1 Tax=Tenebrio molitor TaxID=7067 RepID=A0A8J6LLU6_TENMO|nr:hypothetical protein GEV33_005480 [Tenebrio molitor]